jgi:hypothetical protein
MEIRLMFHVVIECDGLPVNEGPQAALDIAEGFAQRPWHQNVRCAWDGKTLRLEADVDFDANGLALRDEFSDEIVANVKNAEYSDLRVVSVTEVV